MIRINLLPPEKRKPERTPLPRFLLILVAAALTAGVAAYLGIIFLYYLNTKDEIETTKKAIKDLETLPQGDLKISVTAEHALLKKRIDDVKAREDLVTSLGKRGIFWSRALDRIWKILDSEPRLWIDDLQIVDSQRAQGLIRQINPSVQTSTRGAAPPYGVTLKLKMYGNDLNRMLRVRAQLASDEYLKEFLPEINQMPAAVIAAKDKSIIMEFEIVMVARPPDPAKR